MARRRGWAAASSVSATSCPSSEGSAAFSSCIPRDAPCGRASGWGWTADGIKNPPHPEVPRDARPRRTHRFDSAFWLPSASADRLDALDQIDELRAILVPYRLDRVLERFFVGDRDDLDAGGFHALHRLGFGLVPQFARVELRLAREFLDQPLVVGR